MKKNILTTLVACVLVACLAVGATVAYLTAGDNAVTNTFTFANGMEVDIYETAPVDTDTAKMGQAEYTTTDNVGLVDDVFETISYTNVLPGQTLPKTPYVAAKTTVDAYVFIKVVGNENVVHNDVQWTPVTGANGVYYAEVTVTDPAPTDDIYKIPTPVFTEVSIAAGLDPANFEDGDLGQIQIGVTMIQKSGFDSAAAAFAEAPEFQGLTTPAAPSASPNT